MSAEEIVFMDPPRSNVGRAAAHWGPIADALRARPGEWARVRAGCKSRATASNTAANLKRGSLKGWTRGEFETAARVNEQGTHDVFARYIGAAPEPGVER